MSRREDTTKLCNAISSWSFCSGMSVSDYKGDDWCGCYSSDKISLALAIDGISSSTVRNRESRSEVECLARGSMAARMVADYYLDYTTPFLEEVGVRGNVSLDFLYSLLSPGRARPIINRPTLVKILKLIGNKIKVLFNRDQSCLIGGQAVLSGIIALKGATVAYLQAGDTEATSTICRIPRSNANPEALEQAIYNAITDTYRPLPLHTSEGDPSNYADFNAAIRQGLLDSNILLEPTIALIPWKGITKYCLPNQNTWHITLLNSDGVNSDLLLKPSSQRRELSSLLSSLHAAATRAGNPKAIKLLAKAIERYTVIYGDAPLSVAQIILGSTCSAIATSSRIDVINSIVRELVLNQQLVMGRDDRTLVIHGILLG